MSALTNPIRREELIEIATYWLAGNRTAATEVVDAILAKLSEDDP